jgi:hypothetical protein
MGETIPILWGAWALLAKNAGPLLVVNGALRGGLLVPYPMPYFEVRTSGAIRVFWCGLASH